MTNKEFFINQWRKEMKRTLVAIKALPYESNKLNYRPDPKSRSASQIIGHILPHAEDLSRAIDTKIIFEADKNFNDMGEAYAYYEKHSMELIAKLEAITDTTWENEIIPLQLNGIKLYEAKMMDMFWVLLFDTVHHRGQLSTYYRPMGVPNPSIYGPTAETSEKMLAEAAKKQKEMAGQ